MANRKNKNKGNGETKVAASLDEALQASRLERNASLAQQMLGTNPQKLAQEMLGKQRRSNTPRPAGPGPVAASLASRVGVTKRSASLPRPTATTTPRNPRQPSHLSRPPTTDNYRPRQPREPREAITISSDSASNAKSNGYPRQDGNGGDGLSIRGAASGPYIVKAENFAPGTTAADIESVMQNVGGAMHYCKLIAATPSVIAEMSFIERTGAQDVIKMFDGKKADGRTLYVSLQSEPHANGDAEIQQPPVEEPLPAIVDTIGDTAMEVDEHADARAAEDRQREERRREPRGQQQYPTGPAPRQNDYPRRAEPEYQDGRYGFNDRRYGRGGAGGGYRDEGRMYSDRMRRGGGQSYRP